MNNGASLGAAIKAARETKGLSQEALGERMGVSRAAVSQWEKDRSRPDTRKLSALAEFLEMKISDMLHYMGVEPSTSDKEHISDSTKNINPTHTDSTLGGTGENHRAGEDTVEYADIPLPTPGIWPKDLQVMGGAECGEGNEWFQIEGGPVDWVPRPPVLNGIKKAFAVYAVGTSMEPLYQAGDPIYIHPGRRLENGKDVLIQIQNDEGDVVRASVKRLVRRTPTKVVVRQFNPPMEIEYPADSVKSMLRVLTTKELFGA
jgi:transcriptional regulator with XRE-family HTH domain